MIKKFLVLTISMFLFSTGYVFAGAGHDHGEQKGSMKSSMKMEQLSTDAIEVGNKICPVSKEAVDDMGGVVKYEYKGKIYNLCCKMCAKSFKKDPKKYIGIVEKMMEKKENHQEDDHSGHGH
ncbi:hypothetical protein MNBD_UNCLBAC01-2149 [hydrothermal vent metagenome]|uniref:TRASH domain-containing protein n=1 Tax=hydrothermal vent metagenome TaxID=652676 RepID=A0A3B1DHR3_9ZZZZ